MQMDLQYSLMTSGSLLLNLRDTTQMKMPRVAAWDYSYQIGGLADRTTLVDNNTWNNTHIAIVGKAMASVKKDHMKF